MIESLFDQINWIDPVSGAALEPIIAARTPAGVPISGALRIEGTSTGYPIVDCVARLTPELAIRYKQWLDQFSLSPPPLNNSFQTETSVESFGWQWNWNQEMRTQEDLKQRVADRFQCKPSDFKDKLVLDAGAGAGDQTRYIHDQGAKVVSLDLSSSIDVVAQKMRMNSQWVGIQGDISNLPFNNNQFDIVYCEGVLQHTKDSLVSLRELCRVLSIDGKLLAAHYVRPETKSRLRSFIRRLSRRYYEFLRNRLSKMDRFQLLFTTGILAAFNYLPIIGWALRRSGTVKYYTLMPDFKTTWTNTYDFYGNHEFQRIIKPELFWDYFDSIPGMILVFRGIGEIVAQKTR